MKKICVYLGTSYGNSKIFEESVIRLAHEITKHKLTLVYGGSSLGMMGLLATTVKQTGGKIIGITTNYLVDIEKPFANLDELHVVKSMQERKIMFQQLADLFIVMPGGLGTLEEAIETWNAIKIGELKKKIGFLNIENYFEKLFNFIEHCKKNGFIEEKKMINPFIGTNPCDLLNDLLRSVESHGALG